MDTQNWSITCFLRGISSLSSDTALTDAEFALTDAEFLASYCVGSLPNGGAWQHNHSPSAAMISSAEPLAHMRHYGVRAPVMMSYATGVATISSGRKLSSANRCRSSSCLQPLLATYAESKVDQSRRFIVVCAFWNRYWHVCAGASASRRWKTLRVSSHCSGCRAC